MLGTRFAGTAETARLLGGSDLFAPCTGATAQPTPPVRVTT